MYESSPIADYMAGISRQAGLYNEFQNKLSQIAGLDAGMGIGTARSSSPMAKTDLIVDTFQLSQENVANRLSMKLAEGAIKRDLQDTQKIIKDFNPDIKSIA
jgi:hypothetical protein